jgi:sterol desaturase/sphingolipid hydroxylase (fatty acid hydroxylase superfamily)
VNSLAVVYLGLLVTAPLCAWLQRARPERHIDPVLTRARWLDWSFWLITPLFTGVLTRIATLGLIGLLAPLVAQSIEVSPIPRAPFVVQLLAALVIADGVGYLSHRLRHTRVLWRFHALHHSPSALDWLAAARLHPIDDLIDNTIVGGALLLLGVPFEVFAAIGPVLLLHTCFTHANARVDLGPLRAVLTSPALHRWHHAQSESAAGRGVNFAGMFAFFDVLGGTYFLPRGTAPARFGLADPRADHASDPLPTAAQAPTP